MIRPVCHPAAAPGRIERDRTDLQHPAGLGVSDAGYPLGHLWPLRIRGPVPGVNIVATHGRPITEHTLVVMAHLDSVSGVAVILQAAEQIPDLERRRDVALVLVDLEEISLAGSTHLAKTVTPGAVLNLESVGYYNPAPGSQRLPPGLGPAAPALVKGAAGMDGVLPSRGGQGDVRLPAPLHVVAGGRLASPETPQEQLEDPTSALLHYGVVAARRGDGAVRPR